MSDSLPDLTARIHGCTLCDLAGHGIDERPVAGFGSETPQVLLIAKAPRWNFINPPDGGMPTSITWLSEKLEQAGITPDMWRLTFIAHCRPKDQRLPHPDEVEICEGYLFNEIKLLSPAVIGTLGAFATRTITGARGQITTLRGSVVPVSMHGTEIPTIAVTDPWAAASTPAVEGDFLSDLALVRSTLKKQREVLA